MAHSTRLATAAVSPEKELADFLVKTHDAGAVVSFCGIARPRGQLGQAVERLHLQHHPRMTERSLHQIAEQAMRRFDVSEILVVHRCGDISPGETIVFVAAASLHRRAAFEAADYLMDRLKTDAVFWKREESVDGRRWIEPTAADRAARGRWEA